MWTKIINYDTFVRYSVHLGAKAKDSPNHKLNYLILGERKDRYIFRLDRMLFTYFFNKKLIKSISSNGANFLFITGRSEYYDAIRHGADKCSQVALLWKPASLGNLNIRGEALEELYTERPHKVYADECYPTPDVFILFDNDKFRSKRLINETDQFVGVPLFSVLDTDSLHSHHMYPIFGNDDSSMSIHFYSIFVAYAILSGKKTFNWFDHEEDPVKK